MAEERVYCRSRGEHNQRQTSGTVHGRHDPEPRENRRGERAEPGAADKQAKVQKGMVT